MNRNITVLFADDEPLIVKGLSKLLPWSELGIEIIGYAYDGKELLELMQLHSPDIVISDISMPHYSGIDIIKEAKLRELPSKIIFISAYQEFSYARDAIAYGAVEYLVKPIKKSDLESAVAKTLSLIHEENEEDLRRNKLDHLERINRDSEVELWLEQLTEGLLAESSEGYIYLHQELKGPKHAVGIVSLDPMEHDNGRWPAQTLKLVEFAVHNIIQESIRTHGKGYTCIKSNHFIFAISYEEDKTLLLLGNAIKNNILQFLKLKVSVGVGEPVQRLAELKKSKKQAEEALGLTYFSGLNQVLRYERLEQRKNSEHEWFALQSEIVKALTENELDIALEKMKALLQIIKQATIGNRQLAVATCFSSVLYIVQEVKKSDVPMSELGFDIQHLQHRLGQYETYEKMCDEVYNMLQELSNRIGDNPINKEQKLIERVIQYIESHYMDDISLETVAAIAFMNPYYFSSFFKKQMKQNFKQYVTDLRMNQAISLLKHSDMMVYEIAEKVGYKNARHFSDMFKKHTGKLPQEFKNSLRS